MKIKKPIHLPPEQKQVNELWQLLGAQGNEQAVKNVRELLTAVNEEPLYMTVVINRATGAITMRHNVQVKWGEAAIGQLREALKQIDESLVQNLAKLAEERGAAQAKPISTEQNE